MDKNSLPPKKQSHIREYCGIVLLLSMAIFLILYSPESEKLEIKKISTMVICWLFAWAFVMFLHIRPVKKEVDSVE